MKSSRRLLLLCLITFPMSLHADEWVDLFNGKNLEGWVSKGGKASFEVKDGVIVGTTAPKTPNSFLSPQKQYGDFELEFEVKCDPKLNSGVQFRSVDKLENFPKHFKGKDLNEAKKRFGRKGLVGPQFEIAAEGTAGAIWFEGVGGWIFKPEKELILKTYHVDDWNKYRVVVQGEKIEIWINGVHVGETKDERTTMKKGFLGFQVHAIQGNHKWQVCWRNIRIKELN